MSTARLAVPAVLLLRPTCLANIGIDSTVRDFHRFILSCIAVSVIFPFSFPFAVRLSS